MFNEDWYKKHKLPHVVGKCQWAPLTSLIITLYSVPGVLILDVTEGNAFFPYIEPSCNLDTIMYNYFSYLKVQRSINVFIKLKESRFIVVSLFIYWSDRDYDLSNNLIPFAIKLSQNSR